MTFYCLCCGNFFTEEEGLEAAEEYDGAYGERICPPWIPAARHGKTSFSRLWRENEQIQLLRWRLEVQAPTRKCHASREAYFFATCYAPLFAQILNKNGKQKSLPYLFAFELSKANASAESATSRANMSRAAVPRRVVCARTKGVPRGNAWARFLGSFFAARQRMNIKTQSAQRASKTRSMSVCRRKI